MRKVNDVLEYARALASDLESDMAWESGDFGGYWAAFNFTLKPRIEARGTAALEFFRQYAGSESFWTERALSIYQDKVEHQSMESGVRALSDLLRTWADQVEAGVVEVAGSRSWAEFGVASTDLMSQVRRLLEDRNAHPAAAIVLCGAALEIALRAIVEERNIECDERPTLSVLTRVLRRAQVITAQDVKDLDQCAGLRNLAAHGDFESLSPERAGLMEQQTNILLRRLADLSA
ncbi:hypothetical protein ACFW0V_19700 [Micromonospora parva]|uniref:hypothetical protein n=1 Tax=Micromonospora parva TaxID=1464048 RepID=UPI00366AC970